MFAGLLWCAVAFAQLLDRILLLLWSMEIYGLPLLDGPGRHTLELRRSCAHCLGRWLWWFLFHSADCSLGSHWPHYEFWISVGHQVHLCATLGRRPCLWWAILWIAQALWQICMLRKWALFVFIQLSILRCLTWWSAASLSLIHQIQLALWYLWATNFLNILRLFLLLLYDLLFVMIHLILPRLSFGLAFRIHVIIVDVYHYLSSSNHLV